MSFITPREYPSTVLGKDSKDNAIGTATAPAGNTSQRNYITGVEASFSVLATSALLQIKDDTTVIWEQYIHGSANIEFPSPIVAGALAKAMSAVLAASGTGGVIGKVNLRGYLI
jgi:hypothetical protein